jgi:predicted Zn finger-like uncharacterized protein
MIISCPHCATRYQIGDANFPAAGRTVRCAKCGQSWLQAPPSPEPPESSPYMAIACPQCASRFQVETAKFPPGGRNVRCAKCHHVWHQAGAEAVTPAEAPLVAVPAPLPPIVTSASEPPPVAAVPQAPADTVQGLAEVPVAGPDSIRQIRDRLATAATNMGRSTPSRPALAISAVAFAGLFCLGAWLVVHHKPAQPPLPPNAVRPGIELVDVKYDRQMTFGLGMIVTINGTITNSTDKELPLPKTITVALTDTANQELYHTVLAQTVKTLAGHKSVPFEAHIYNAPEKAQHLQVTLGGR